MQALARRTAAAMRPRGIRLFATAKKPGSSAVDASADAGKASAWVNYVRAYALDHGKSYKESVKLARASYKEQQSEEGVAIYVSPKAVPNKLVPLAELVVPEDDEQLQDHWRAMERRVKMRKTKQVGEGPRGRSPVRPSAWDHENV